MLSSNPFGFGMNGIEGLAFSLATVMVVVVFTTIDSDEHRVFPLKERTATGIVGENANMMVDWGATKFVVVRG